MKNQDGFPVYKKAKTADLVPYARNSRTHSETQINKIAASITEFGFLNPIITDGNNGIVAGHGRVMAAQKLGLDELPTIDAAHLSEAQRRAYVIADNRLALDAGWDDELLKIELKDLDSAGFDLTLTGFDLDELASLFDTASLDGAEDEPVENYSRKIEAPIYEITGEKPAVSALYDEDKANQLKADIAKADLPAEISAFLNAAAYRHTVFDFRNIAEFYAHSDEATQDLMERSGLIIIDFDQAIENGYAKIAEEIASQYEIDKEDG
jgi:hypothetical protein